MDHAVVVAGATGNLGGRIVDALIARGAAVRALVRQGSSAEKVASLKSRGVDVVMVDYSDRESLVAALAGAGVVVSALQGLREVVVDTQTQLLEAAVAAGVPRFIPSDYAADFTKLEDGENRNFDLRREFARTLDAAPIAATSVLNGAFMELLKSGMPLLNMKSHSVGYFGDGDQLLDFTTMDDTAAFTAAAALDEQSPRVLRIAGEQISAKQLAALASEVTGQEFALTRQGGLDDLAGYIAHERSGHPEGEGEEFPRWQQMQYMHNMFSGRAKLEPLDNERYPGLAWTRVRDLIS